MSVIPREFLNAVIAIGEKVASGDHQDTHWIGSGFIVARKEELLPGQATFYIVTNKHVIRNRKCIYVRFNDLGDSFVNDYPIVLYDEHDRVLLSSHPDENTDVVAIQINPKAFNDAKIVWNAFDLDDHALTIKQMYETGVVEGSLVYSLGFPMSLVDVVKAPICRIGCISRFLDAYVKQDENPTFLVDAQAFPGNSGGPIVNRPERITISKTPNNSSTNLIGILSAYIPYNEILISTQTGETRMIQTENSGLTIVHPVDRIKEVVELEYQREKVKGAGE